METYRHRASGLRVSAAPRVFSSTDISIAAGESAAGGVPHGSCICWGRTPPHMMPLCRRTYCAWGSGDWCVRGTEFVRGVRALREHRIHARRSPMHGGTPSTTTQPGTVLIVEN